MFDVLSHPIADFRERIPPGAFAESIENDDVRALWNHRPGHVLGRNKIGSLKLAEDDRSLAFEMDVVETRPVALPSSPGRRTVALNQHVGELAERPGQPRSGR